MEEDSSPSKLQKLSSGILGEMEEGLVEITGKKRKGSMETTSSGQSVEGVRLMVHDEVQSMFSANILGPVVKELQDQMNQVRGQQQETIEAGKSIVSEIQKSMISQREVQLALEQQVQINAQKQTEHTNVLSMLSEEARSAQNLFHQMKDQHILTQSAMQQNDVKQTEQAQTLSALTAEAQNAQQMFKQVRDQQLTTQKIMQEMHEYHWKTEEGLKRELADSSYRPRSEGTREPHGKEPASSSSTMSMDNARDNRGLGLPLNTKSSTPVSNTTPMVTENWTTTNTEPRGSANPPVVTRTDQFIPNAKIANIPVFESSRYTSWRREICFWEELHDWIPEKQLISFVGLNGGTAIRSKVTKLFKDTENRVVDRTFQNLLVLLDSDFAMTAREKDMREMDRLFEYRRDVGESIQSFWSKFDLLLSHLEGSSTCLSDELLFMRSLRAMNLTYEQRTSLLSMIDCRSLSHSVSNLRSCSVQLLGMYRGFETREKEPRKVFWNTGKGNNDGLSAEEQVLSNALIVKKGKRNRPGLEDQAVRRTNAGMNVQNSLLALDAPIADDILAIERAQGR